MNIQYGKDNEITNFREISVGNITRGILYRGSYPIMSMEPERDIAYNKLVFDAKIECVINLADNKVNLENTAKEVPWYRELLSNDKIIGLDIHFLFEFENENEYSIFKNKLKQGFKFMAENDGPYLIHCNAGTDRTGFVAALIQALFGADINEIVYDYLLSYGKTFADDKNAELHFNTRNIIFNQLKSIIGDKIYDRKSLQSNIQRYFLTEIGLTAEELTRLKANLSYKS